MRLLDKSSQLYSWFLPYPVFLGILFSLITCSIVGRNVSHHNIFKGFQRFHPYISPESLFYPTARQLLELSEARINRKKIAVIIGGSSISNGVGQSSRDLWSRQLQKELGDQYTVLNLAFRGGGIQEHGAIAAQLLLQRGYKVIYVADTAIRLVGEPDYWNPNYRYIFWDAYYKGLLPNYQHREDYLKHSVPPLSEVRLHARVDSITYASDLWNNIGYEHFFTVWNFLIASHYPSVPFYLPRKNYSDPEHDYQAKPVAERFLDLDATADLNILRSFCSKAFTTDSAGNLMQTSSWNEFENSLKLFFSEDFRRRSLIVLLHRNPFITSQLSDNEQFCLDRSFAMTSEKFRRTGYSSIDVGKDFSPGDYADSVHLAVTGGRKLATEVAVEVRRIAKELDYDD